MAHLPITAQHAPARLDAFTVAAILKITPAHWRNLAKTDPDAPPTIKLGSRCLRWNSEAVQAYLHAKQISA